MSRTINGKTIKVIGSRVQENIFNDQDFQTQPRNDFINPKSKDSIFGFVLVTNDDTKLKEYCGKFYEGYTVTQR